MQAQPEATIPLPRPTITVAGTVVVLALVAVLALRPIPRNDLRRADDLFTAGHFYAARALPTRWPTAGRPSHPPGRLGGMATRRSEPISAERLRGGTAQTRSPPTPTSSEAAYQDPAATRVGQTAQARQYWGQIDTISALVPVQQLLNTELLLNQGDYAEAEASYAARLPAEGALPGRGRVLASTTWHSCAPLTIHGSKRVTSGNTTHYSYIIPNCSTRFLLPPANPSATEISAAWPHRPNSAHSCWGSSTWAHDFLRTGRGASVGPENPNALAAAAYAAYTRWAQATAAEGLRRLQALAEQYPNEPRARAAQRWPC
ncbi:MAG: hypothetical protein U0074_01035 [Kouleothrix sp.]